MKELGERIRDGVIGSDAAIDTPFGCKPLVYADYTASGRALDFVEDYLRKVVMPMYANTHSEASLTGAMTNTYRERAREQIRSAVNGSTNDRVLFCGSGATAAVNRLIEVLGWRQGERSQDTPRPVVFIGPYEHHSNELPWREAEVDVVRIPLNPRGQVCLDTLQAELVAHADRPDKLGSFSAASNVTGIRTDVEAVTRVLKQHDALACWDYAAAGPYVGIDMNRPGAALDAVFISPHKFVGGPGTPGVLVAKTSVFRREVPAMVGGGTVAWVSPDRHRYVADLERREEGGTPAIIEAIRAGLVFELQQRVGTDRIETIEADRTRRALTRFAAEDNIEILGPVDADRLSIVSMRLRHGDNFLHYGFVVSLLNDLFGIQVRGGCSCAGPYGHELLDIDAALSQEFDDAIAAGWSSLRPGWVRLNFNWFIDEREFDYLLEAVCLVARHGWKLLPLYTLDPRTGVWRHEHHRAAAERVISLEDYLAMVDKPNPDSLPTRPSLEDTLAAASALLSQSPAEPLAGQSPVLPKDYAHLQWFVSHTTWSQESAQGR